MNSTNKTFYWYFRPIALICKLIGIFPIQNILSLDPKNLKISFLSFPVLYSTAIFGSTFYTIWSFCGFLFSMKTWSIVLVVYLMFARSVVCFIFCLFHSRKLPKLIHLLDTFDKKKQNLLDSSQMNIKLSLLLWTIIPIILGILISCVSFYESGNLLAQIIPADLENEYARVTSLVFGALCIWQLESLLLYIYFAIKIICNFITINKTFIKKGYTGNFFNTIYTKYDAEMYKTLEHLRYMHNMSSESVTELGRCYGGFMAIDQLCLIAMFVVNIYTFISDNGRNEHLLAVTLVNGIVVLVVILLSHEIKESGSKVIDLMNGIQFSDTNEQSRVEIQTFMLQLTARPVAVSAAGYFTIDRNQIPAMMSSVATYLIVMLQFSQYQ